MTEDKATNKSELFFPYYINQGRLLDIYAILNGGYSEYSEITTAVNEEKSKGGKADFSAGGFKLLNLGGSASVTVNKSTSSANGNKEKKVQTITSILSIVKSELDNRGYLKEITVASSGQFVCLPVVLSINSMKSLITEISELVKLSNVMQNIGAPIKSNKKESKEISDILKATQVLFSGEEILYETDKYAIIGNIQDSNLYQAIRADIIGTELTCLAQVKRIFPQGTELMKNTMFSRIRDDNAKQAMINAIIQATDGEIFDFEAVAVASIQNKPVYQLEIIALYQ